MDSNNILKPLDVNLTLSNKKRKRSNSEDRDPESKKGNHFLKSIKELDINTLDSEEPNLESFNKTKSNKKSSSPYLDENSLSPVESIKSKTKEKDSLNFKYSKQKMVQVEEIDYINMLPDELILCVLKWLPKKSLKSLALVSKRFSLLTKEHCLWQRLDLGHRSLYPGTLGYILDRQVIILRMAVTAVNDPAFDPISKSVNSNFQSKLQYLDLSMATISSNSLNMLFKKCKNLKKLSLEAVQVNEQICENLSQNQDLEVLNMSMTSNLNYQCMKHLLTKLRKLKELNIAWVNLNHSTMTYICSHLPPTLIRLNIAGCRKTLDNKDVEHLRRTTPLLKDLDLSDAICLTDKVIDTVVQFKSLNFLAMSRCYSVSPNAYKKLKFMAPLQYLDIYGHLNTEQLNTLTKYFADKIVINNFKFSSVARPTVGIKCTSIWNMRVRD